MATMNLGHDFIRIADRPDRICLEGSHPIRVHAEWLATGRVVSGPLIHHEQVKYVDRFMVGLPGGSIIEFDFDANRWMGFRGRQRSPGMPLDMSREAEMYRLLGYIE